MQVCQRQVKCEIERVFDTQVKLGNTVKNVLSFEKLRNTSISEPSLFVSGVQWDGHHWPSAQKHRWIHQLPQQPNVDQLN